MDPVSARQAADEHRSTVLLVEDELLLRWPAAEYLREVGYRVIEAASAGEAIAVLASGARVDLVFSDVNLAEGMDGHELASWVADHRQHIPMLLTSADRQELRRVSAGALRATVCKPYDLA